MFEVYVIPIERKGFLVVIDKIFSAFMIVS